MNVRIEACRTHPGLPALLAAYHLATEAEKGRPVPGPAGLPDGYRAEAEDPAAAFAADTVLLATATGAHRPAACAVLTADGEIKRLWVEPAARGNGLAAALVTEAVRRADEAGVPAVRLSVWRWREPALALYRRLGFESVASWDPRPELLCLERRLDGVRRLTPDEIRADAAGGLTELLRDAVDGGASIGFLKPLDAAEAAAWWRSVADEAERGVRDVLGARDEDGRLVGVVTLVRSDKANGRHRGEIARLVVHRAARGRGLGAGLLAAAEARAVALGLGLLVLDTETDSPAERLYRKAGWTAAGVIPDFAADPDGTLQPTTLYYKQLG
ncbi:GNAT family N-acetyltransferase [Streptomyces sp. NPDC085481]|uniref:GNAT family N-acetyltransferase n=1 Tax=Streptomyces sp. NPDC085481 TaxID=3365727 RepID=UPI0037D92651